MYIYISKLQQLNHCYTLLLLKIPTGYAEPWMVEALLCCQRPSVLSVVQESTVTTERGDESSPLCCYNFLQSALGHCCKD